MTVRFDLILDLLILIVGLGMAIWSSIRWSSAARERDLARQMGAQAQVQSESARRQATAAFLVGSQLLAANDEQAVIEAGMQIGCETFNAVGCSFVPYDEWGRSLPPLSSGHIPQPALNHWNDRLISPATRKVCKACKTLRAEKTNCPLLAGADERIKVHCVPLRCDNREVGVINFYFATERLPSQDEQRFFAEIVSIIDRAFDMLRRRDQEVAALRYLQTVQTRNDLPSTIKPLVENIQKALNVDVALLWARETPDGLNSPLAHESRRDGLSAPVLSADAGFLEGVWQSVAAADGPISLENLAVDRPWRVLLVVPLRWGDEKPLGMLLLANRTAQTFTRRQTLLLQTLAGETALLIKNSQLVIKAEYNAVVEERARLAREIHDGMAQTLAFLKIEAQRMQSYASQGDVNRLNETLESCYRTISDAYLDARLAIDNLRCAPGDDFVAWLRQTAADFEADYGVAVDVSGINQVRNLQPHIQAQVMRVVQESLSNIRKHAHPRLVRLAISECDHGLSLEIADDGIGFSPDDTQPASRHGLRGMRERAELLGADFQVTSKPGEGTTIHLHLPHTVQDKV
ncbi:MAG: GAF domain-containing sensor histidine kinase [Chloroflexota bacterium]